MGECPVVEIVLQGITISCLLDTGSMVTTLTENFFYTHFQSSLGQLQPCRWLQLRAANGLKIPYLGYLEVDIDILGKKLSKMGVLVVQDSSDPFTRTQKSKVLGLLGMNVISQCYNELFQQHGSSLFQAPSVQLAGEAWNQAFTECHQFDCLPPTGCLGGVKVAGRASVCIPAGSFKLVPARSNQHVGPSVHSVLFEPSDTGLPPGILISRAFLSFDQGEISVPVVNVETRDVWLPPHTVLGELFCATKRTNSQVLTFEESTENYGNVAVI